MRVLGKWVDEPAFRTTQVQRQESGVVMLLPASLPAVSNSERLSLGPVAQLYCANTASSTFRSTPFLEGEAQEIYGISSGSLSRTVSVSIGCFRLHL
jgi:hypothetical protein